MTKLATGRHTQTIKSGKKSKERYEKNKSLKSRARTYIRKVKEAVAGGNTAEAEQMLPEASKYIDTAAVAGAIHKKKASRLKGRLAKVINKSKTEK
jgi:small subunit ribosomal protein S20